MTTASQAGGAPTAGCPDYALLDAIHRGAASSAEVETWADHIEKCPRCEAVLTSLSEDIDPLFAGLAKISARTETHFPKANPSPSPRETSFPREFGEYILEAELGRGGMGVVYRARQRKPNRIVALKQLAGPIGLGSEAVERFRTEYEAVSRVQHPNITVLYQSGWADGVPWYAMEFVEGGSLADRIRNGPLPARDAAVILKAVATAVEHAHQNGVIHRDLKPSNVLLAEDGQPKLADFGLAKLSDQSIDLTATEKVMGSPGYMAPEQATGGTKSAGPATDIYGLGAILYACLTSRPPFVGTNPAEVIAQTIRNDPVPPRRLVAGVPRDLETICLKCLEKTPAKRYESSKAVADDLQRFLEGRPIVARPVGPADRMWRWCKREPGLAAVGATAFALLIALVVSGYVFIRKSDRQALDVANSRRDADVNDAKRAQAEQAATASERERAILAYYRSLQDCDARAERREPGWTWENRQAIAKAAAADVDAPNRLADLRTHYVKQAGCPDFRALEPVKPSSIPDDNTSARRFHAFRIAFSPKGDLLAAGEFKVKHPFAPVHIALIDPVSGRTKQVLTFPSDPSTLLPNRGSVPDGIESLAFSPDGRWLAAGATSGKVHLFDVSSKNATYTTWKLPEPSVTDLCFSSDSRVLFAVSGRILRRWEFDEKAPPRPTLTYGDKETVLGSLQIAKKNSTGSVESLLIAQLDGIGFLDPTTLQRVGPTIRSALHRVSAISPDGRMLAFEGEHCLIKLAHLASGKISQTWRRPGMETSEDSELHWLCFSPDGSLVVSTAGDSNRIRLWEAASGRMLGEAFVSSAGMQIQAAFRPDGKMFVVAGQDGLLRFEVSSFHEQSFVAISPAPLRSFGVDVTGPRLATISNEPDEWGRGEIAVWNWREPALEPIALRGIARHWNTPIYPLFTTVPPARLVYTQQDSVHVWNYLDKDNDRGLGEIKEMEFMGLGSTDEVWIAEDTKEKRLLSWKLTEAKPDEIWNNKKRHSSKGISNFTAMTIGSRYTLLGLRDGGVALLDSRSKTFLKYLNVCSNRIKSLAFNGDETNCVVGDETGKLYSISLPDGGKEEPFAPHRDSVEEIVFIGDSLIVSGSVDRTIKFWKPDGSLLFTLPVPRPVRQMRVSPDGKKLLVLLRDERAIRVWHLDRLEQRFAELGLGVKLVP